SGPTDPVAGAPRRGSATAAGAGRRDRGLLVARGLAGRRACVLVRHRWTAARRLPALAANPAALALATGPAVAAGLATALRAADRSARLLPGPCSAPWC